MRDPFWQSLLAKRRSKSQWKKPIQKAKTWVLSLAAFTSGKPKSRASGTGPSIGIAMRKPKPAVTR